LIRGSSAKSKPCQRPAQQPTPAAIAGTLARSVWHQGLRSSHRKAYWKYLLKILTRFTLNRASIWMGVTIRISGHHFISLRRRTGPQG
jgi:hypothetical protein